MLYDVYVLGGRQRPDCQQRPSQQRIYKRRLAAVVFADDDDQKGLGERVTGGGEQGRSGGGQCSGQLAVLQVVEQVGDARLEVLDGGW